MAVKCGKGHGYHETSKDVFRCYNGETVDVLDMGVTPSGEDGATKKQISYGESLLLQHDLKTAKSLAAHGKREISALITILRSTHPGQVSAKDKETFGLIAPTTDGESLAEGKPRDYTDPKALVARRAERFDTESLDEGMYEREVDGVMTVFKIQVAHHGSGRKYAKRLEIYGPTEFSRQQTTAKFVMAPGAISQLRAEHKMSLERAQEYGALYGFCCCCSRILTDETSIENGIGPICAQKF